MQMEGWEQMWTLRTDIDTEDGDRVSRDWAGSWIHRDARAGEELLVMDLS